MDEDIRWKQRFHNYKKALATLQNAVELAQTRELTDLERQGMIQGFEFTFELAWNVMKDYLTWKGITDIVGSKDSVRQAFGNGIIENGQTWMDMIKDRNLTAHSYDESTAKKLVAAIQDNYYCQLDAFAKKMGGLEVQSGFGTP